MRSIDPNRSIIPSVIAVAVNECPAPITFTRRPSADALDTIAATCSVDVGDKTSAGRHAWFPAQLRTTPEPVQRAIPRPYIARSEPTMTR